MKMIKAIVRPEKCDEVLSNLSDEGFRAATRLSILGRGKQRGLKVDNVYYDEIPKSIIMMVVNDADAKRVTDIIIKSAKSTEEGTFGDGKFFIQDVEEAITISSGKNEL